MAERRVRGRGEEIWRKERQEEEREAIIDLQRYEGDGVIDQW